MSRPAVYLLGFGNPGRQDDGLGPAVAERVEAWQLPNVTTDADYQLNIEAAADMADSEVIIFADASVDTAEPFTLTRLEPAEEITFTTHTLSPQSLLAMMHDHFAVSPVAWVLAIRGYTFEMAEGLSEQASENLEQALAFLQNFIRELEGEH